MTCDYAHGTHRACTRPATCTVVYRRTGVAYERRPACDEDAVRMVAAVCSLDGGLTVGVEPLDEQAMEHAA